MESIENALKRGSNLLRSRKRMVSTNDYISEIISYSDTIDKVKCITGMTREKEKEEAAINFVLLLKDFEEGNHSFHEIAEDVKKSLLENCELTISEKDLHIVEPVFVDINVSAWVETYQADVGFEIQNLLTDCLKEYLNPLTSAAGRGWEIGTLPKKSQIAMKINSLHSESVIRKIAVTAVYADHSGRHEVDLEELSLTPFMICRSGEHRIHVTYA